MSNQKKRAYHSETRVKKAAETKDRILTSARALFESEGFEGTTIEKLAQAAEVSVPTVYGLFQSKLGVLRALMNEALPPDQFEALVEEAMNAPSAKRHLEMSAKIARQIYDAEREQMDIFRSASVLAPELKVLEKEREERRYLRQENTIKAIASQDALKPSLDISKARDILWTFTGRDLYRLLVIERSWSSEEYELWLAQLLATTLIYE